MLHHSTNVLRKGPSGLSVVEKVRFISEKAKDHTCEYFKTMKKSINPVFYAWVVIERVAVNVAEFRGVSL